MKQLSYVQYVRNIIDGFHEGEPILIRELGRRIAAEYQTDEQKARLAASNAVKRIMQTDLIPSFRCFGKGIYYLAKQTPFGETGIDKEKLIAMKYLNGHNGYESGALMMHKLGLTSLAPKERVFVSNRAKTRIIRDANLNIIVKVPRTAIDRNNCDCLQFLDMLTIYDAQPVDANDPYEILHHFMQMKHLDYGKLLHIADRFYSEHTIIQLAHLAGHEAHIL